MVPIICMICFQVLDEDFHKLFKVKVEFDTVMEKDEENSLKMARFVKNYG